MINGVGFHEFQPISLGVVNTNCILIVYSDFIWTTLSKEKQNPVSHFAVEKRNSLVRDVLRAAQLNGDEVHTQHTGLPLSTIHVVGSGLISWSYIRENIYYEVLKVI